QPTGSVGAIAIAPSDPNIVYVGSGEGLQRPDLSTGDGIYKSTDAGRTWTHLGLRDGQQIPQIIVHPSDPNRLYVAVLGHPYGPNEERGIYRSTDGAKTFQRVLYRDENTGGVDIAFDPVDPRTIYAVMWEARQGPWENGVFSGPGSAVFKSTDGGDNWRPINKGLPTFAEDGLGRIGITVAPSEPRRLFATVEAARNAGLYRSDDAGESWSIINADPRVTNRASDFAEVKVHPRNPDIVFTGSIVAWKSVDGGKTFAAFRGAPGGDDYHRIWINPDKPEIMMLVSDQGAIVTVNSGETFSSWYNQPTAQFYHVSTDNAFPYRVCGGQQESGSACIASRGNHGQITFREWTPVGVEEYGYVAPDPLDPDIVYGGKVSRFDRRTGQVQQVGPAAVRPADYRTLRTAPVLFSPIDPRTLYFASSVVWKTLNGGRSWTQISPDLTRETWEVPPNVGKYIGTDAARPSRRGVVYTIAPSYVDINRIWAGTDDGLIHVTADGGKTWKDVTPPAVKPWAKISLMDASHSDSLTAYAAINTFRLDELKPHIYRTRDGGKTWQHITNGIPDGGAVNAVREDPVRKGLLFAGTEQAVYFSIDDGETWQSLRLNMPATSIRDLVIKDDDLVVGTHGRSFWILDDITPLRQMGTATFSRRTATFASASVREKVAVPLVTKKVAVHLDVSNPPDVHLFAPQDAWRVRWNMNTDTPLPQEEPAGQNPPDGAVINYYLKSKSAGIITLEIKDGAGRLVRRYATDDPVEPLKDEGNVPAYWIRPTLVLSNDAGMHRFVWDLHYTRPEGMPASFPISATYGNTARSPRGPWAHPGRYTVTLTVDGKSYTRPLTVKMDPRVKTAPAALLQQFTLSKRLSDGIDASAKAIIEIRAMRTSARESAVPESPIDKQLAELEGQGGGGRFGGGGRGATDHPSFSRVIGELTAAYGLLQGADVEPTTQAIEAARRALASHDALAAKWKALRSSR
ncbi:MAG: glycoside hydrolase, partial [Acidobacteria bacterium]|nr:glycoside hydrolase [Acidobacteriota bacterium]